MSEDIRIKKGLTIKLKGKADEKVSAAPRSGIFAIQPKDFHGITPKLTVKVGAEVSVGDVLFYSKSNEQIKFTSPAAKRQEEQNLANIGRFMDFMSTDHCRLDGLD